MDLRKSLESVFVVGVVPTASLHPHSYQQQAVRTLGTLTKNFAIDTLVDLAYLHRLAYLHQLHCQEATKAIDGRVET